MSSSSKGGWSHAIHASHIAAPSGGMTHAAAIKAGKAPAGLHKDLDPAGLNKAGHKVRECRDSDEYPVTVPIRVDFDVTGSMGIFPKQAQAKLALLPLTFHKSGICPGAQFSFGAIGDAYSDQAPLQVGQFEADNKMDLALGNIWPEGGGGGGGHESYELAMFFTSRYVEADHINKRGEKGIYFIIGDELPYDLLSAVVVQKVIGDKIEGRIPTSELIKELEEKWEFFWIYPKNQGRSVDGKLIPMGYYQRGEHVPILQGMFPERVILLDEPEGICELLAKIIGRVLGNSDSVVDAALFNSGADPTFVASASDSMAVVPWASSASIAKATTSGGALLPTIEDDDVGRL